MAEVAFRDGQSSTYAGSVNGLVGVAGDILTFTAPTVASKIFRLTRLSITGVATAASDTVVLLIFRSTLDTGGTGATVLTAPYQLATSAATTLVTSYTAAPTPGTQVGTPIRASNATLALTGTGQSAAVGWTFGGDRPAQCPRLYGGSTTQLCLNTGTTVTGAAYYIDFEFTEDFV